MEGAKTRPRLGVFKFASCDGCQLQLVDMLDEMRLLGDFLREIELAYFLEVTSVIGEGPYDIGIVEGSITTESDRKRIRKIREDCRVLITIGACATSGGIQALKNWRDLDDVIQSVYARPDYIETLRDSTAIGDHVPVDFELRGCPVNKEQLREVITSYLIGKRPHVPAYSVCMECKRRGNVCVVVAKNEPCLGPITQAGCGALCPAFDRGCYGCFGPMEQPNTNSQANMLSAQGLSADQIERQFHSFSHMFEIFRNP